jgi:D-3-phosphoglycerate dehydrogenase
MKVVVLDDYHRAFVDAPPVQRLRRRDGVDVVVYTERLEGEARAAALADVDIIIALRERTRFDAEFFREAPRLRLIAQTGSGMNHIDLNAAAAAGVTVVPAPAASSAAAAELAIGLMLAVMRQIPLSDRKLRAGTWDQISGTVLEGKTLGLIGLGRVGAITARLARAFGMTLQVWSRSMTLDRAAAVDATPVALEQLLLTSDVVSLHLALNAETRGFLNEARLRLMKPSAYFINTARGEIVDEQALVRLLEQRAIAGAALDVFSVEPLPPDHPLLKLDNVVLTPHIGWPTDSAYAGFAEVAVQRVEAYLDSLR